MQRIFLFIVFLTIPTASFAHVAVSEVMWMGSDLSTSDEWIEIASDSLETVDISGWTLQSLNSKGEHALVLRFATGATLEPEDVIIVANTSASSSRLLSEPTYVTTAMSLPNTKLLLTLRDAVGNIVDQVDDAVSAPFAGANPSGGTKASMERISLDQPGTLSSNWRTAVLSSGFDLGANVLGSPGSFEFAPLQPSDPPPSDPPALPPCIDPLQVQIYVQDGELSGVGHTTVNFQAIAKAGSIVTATCRWTFSDGYSSDSCNPPPHAFIQVGVTSVNLEAVNQCGNTLKQEIKVTVQPDPTSVPTSPTEKLTSQYDGSRLMLSSALPNPEGAETGHEWVEIRNREQRPVSLVGWTLAVGKTSIKKYPLSGSLEPLSRLRLYDSEMKFKLPNTESVLTLLDPRGKEVSSISWKVAEEGITYYPDDISNLDVSGRVLSVIDGDTFVLGLEGQARELLDTDSIHVRLLGIDAPELLNSAPYSYEATDHLRALIEKKRVELTFDTEIYDKYGRLLAYVSTEDSRDPAREILSKGLAVITKTFSFSSKKDYESIEEVARLQSLGIWSLPEQEDREVGSSSTSHVGTSNDPEVPAVSSTVIDPESIIISEVFSSPSVVSKSTGALTEKKISVSEQINGTTLQSEWIELMSLSGSPQDLLGWKIAVNGKVKTLTSGLEWGSNGFIIINLTEMKLALRNDGAIVTLLSPDYQEISSVLYPALKHGQAYAYLDARDEYCLTTKPTPAIANICVSPQPKVRASTLKKQRTLTAYAQDLSDSDALNVDLLDSDSSTSSSQKRMYVIFAFIALSCFIAIIFHYRSVIIGKKGISVVQ